MKTLNKMLAQILIFVSLIISINKTSAQNAWALSGSACAPDLFESESQVAAVMGGNNIVCNTYPLLRLGINQINPAYITDIVGNATGDGVNVSGPNNNSVGYSIGGTAIGGPWMM